MILIGLDEATSRRQVSLLGSKCLNEIYLIPKCKCEMSRGRRRDREMEG